MKSAIQYKERPIIFSAESVRAILEGRKTQTRRSLKFIPTPHEAGLNTLASSLKLGDYCTGVESSGKVLYSMRGGCWNQVTERLFCPYGVPGDRLWVRETWQDNTPPSGYIYKADWGGYEDDPDSGWRSSIFMPRWASRITLEIAAVRVERVQDISFADIIAEGWQMQPERGGDEVQRDAARDWYMDLWDATNGRRGFPWTSNPWVWVIEFRRVNQ